MGVVLVKSIKNIFWKKFRKKKNWYAIIFEQIRVNTQKTYTHVEVK